MFTIPNNGWQKFFTENQSELSIIENELNQLKIKYESLKIFPKNENIFKAFELCDLNNLKVIIIGQDCYHGPNQANGLCFSVNENIDNPPSLKNILKEMKSDLGIDKRVSNFSDLASQGVLLLNSSLTVHERLAGSHLYIWENFTNKVIEYICKHSSNDLVFILWGNYAKNKKKFITPRHLVIEGTHPSPLSANRGGFFGGKYFSKTNEFLKNKKYDLIVWNQ